MFLKVRYCFSNFSIGGDRWSPMHKVTIDKFSRINLFHQALKSSLMTRNTKFLLMLCNLPHQCTAFFGICMCCAQYLSCFCPVERAIYVRNISVGFWRRRSYNIATKFLARRSTIIGRNICIVLSLVIQIEEDILLLLGHQCSFRFRLSLPFVLYTLLSIIDTRNGPETF